MSKKFRIIVDATLSDDERMHYGLSYPMDGVSDKLTLGQIRSLLCGALSLTIRASENEAMAMRQVINHLESEFVNPDSFGDAQAINKD
jgi:hypothetical protein